MNILKTKSVNILTGGVILLSIFVFTANAHEGKQHDKVSSEELSQNIPVLTWDDVDFKQAETLFRTAGGYGCVACHGQFAQGGGNIGGNIRNHSLSQINDALQHEPTMQLLNKALSAEDKRLLAGYLQALGQARLVEWTIDSESSYQKVSVDKGIVSQLVILNKTFEPLELSLEFIRPGLSLFVEPYATEAIQWMTKPGVIRLQYKQNILDIDVR
ncbi:hypothetical protein CSW98_05325 [Vibrio sp. HA2012]|uniref:hypothetical protein n=1 Tax=Vibrio sp. HA2012 TaxID=1971595 RepID=UPI000C2C53DF|nr:hypothetical protein [Vibrio sp. HA2012]PJC87324.1 hypothetical protein CSW98_05325 [Vibrio sp. HA2012]